MEKVVILHTNDLHSHLENWPRIRRYLHSEQQKALQEGHKVITLDIGDAIDRVHPLTEATNGQGNIKILNQGNYDAATIGNNEGINNTKGQLDQLYDDAEFDVVLDNLIDPKTNQIPFWAKPDKIIKTKSGTRILLLGLTAPYISTYVALGWHMDDPIAEIPRLLKQHQGEYDILILMSHLGLSNDIKIANQYPEVNVILGGHSHHLLETGRHQNQSILAAAQKYGHYVGKVELTLDDDHHIVDSKASVVKTDQLPTEAGDISEIKGYEIEGEKILASRKVAEIDHTMKKNWEGPSELTTIGLQAMKEKAGTDMAMISSGMFLHDLPAGIVDQNQIHQMLPHSIHVMKTTLNGYNLWRFVREMEKNRWILMRYPQKGMGFRGKVFGSILYSGFKYDQEHDQVIYHDQPIDMKKDYQIALLDHYMFIPFFPTLSIVGKNHIYFDELLRGTFANYLGRQYPLSKK